MDIDEEQVEEMAAIGCTVAEIAGIVGVHACRSPSVNDLQQVDVGDVVCAHHCPQRGL